jgi:hypothetical protein
LLFTLVHHWGKENCMFLITDGNSHRLKQFYIHLHPVFPTPWNTPKHPNHKKEERILDYDNPKNNYISYSLEAFSFEFH